MDNQPIPPHRSDDEAFRRLVQDHARLLYRVAYSLLRHPQDAEDAVQDTLLKLYRTQAWQTMNDERAFLARTVWRVAFDRLQARRQPAAATAEDATAELRLRDTRPDPEAVATAADEHALLHELIDELPEDLRQPLLLSAIDELTSREIATILLLPEGTVRTRLMRARSLLRHNFHARSTTRPGETAVARR